MTDQTLTPPVNDDDHTLGPSTATVTLLEFGDYECPYCGEAETALREVRDRAGAHLRFAFRNFPLTDIHPFALRAAEAAEAAGGQGKFWEMHDLLYRNQQALETQDLAGYARHLGLDMDAFDHDLEKQKYLPKLNRDVESGMQSRVPGTPAFFVNGVPYEGPSDPQAILQAISESRSQET